MTLGEMVGVGVGVTMCLIVLAIFDPAIFMAFDRLIEWMSKKESK